MSLLFALVATWANTPALIAEALAPVDTDIQACMKKPHSIPIVASRAKDGTTSVGMPVYGIGYRNYTPEERCLGKAVAKIALPVLPPDVDELSFAWPLAAPDADWNDWRDLTGALVDHAALGTCTHKAVRLVVDLRKGKTTVWLPAWVLKTEPKVRACLTKALAQAKRPALPKGVGLQLSIKP